MPTTLTRRRRGTVARFAGTTYAATALAMITAPIIARSLGPAGRGAYAAVMSYSSLVTVVLGLGISLTVTQTVLSRKQEPAQVLGAVLRFCGLIWPAAAVCAVAIPLLVLDDYPSGARWGTFFFVLLAPMGVLGLALNSLLIAEGALGSLTWVRILPLV